MSVNVIRHYNWWYTLQDLEYCMYTETIWTMYYYNTALASSKLHKLWKTFTCLSTAIVFGKPVCQEDIYIFGCKESKPLSFLWGITCSEESALRLVCRSGGTVGPAVFTASTLWGKKLFFDECSFAMFSSLVLFLFDKYTGAFIQTNWKQTILQ